ncbi:MAG: Ferric siderophore transport system, periplasmic binding protein TonB [Caulobacteraceae bacterium]|nr:Ferric siderophore transport system, periplasmic binding protein TonB [Caulobacteraceae bacterium]
MAVELLAILLRMTLCVSLAALLVVAVRPVLRAWTGPRLAYGLWLLVPLVALSALAPGARPRTIDPLSAVPLLKLAPAPLPDRAQLVVSVASTPSSTAPAASIPAAPSAPAPIPSTKLSPSSAIDYSLVWVVVWAAGVALFLARIVWMEMRFVRRLGRLEPDADQTGVYHTQSASLGPALIGLMRSRVVLPADFRRRYEPQERDLILAHERVHQRALHPLANALGALILALQWFNPLAHLALRLMRLDQELACDAAVIAAHPGRRADYARAMLKAGSDRSLSALAMNCTWPSTGSGMLKRRIDLLKAPTPGRLRRWLSGAGLVGALGAIAFAAHGMGLRPSAAETSVIGGFRLDYHQVDAQVLAAKAKIPARPAEPLITDPTVWAKRSRDDHAEAGNLRSQIAIFSRPPAPRALDRRRAAPYMGRRAQHLEESAALAARATTASLAFQMAHGDADRAKARRELQKAQDDYRAVLDQQLALKVAQNDNLGGDLTWMIVNSPPPLPANDLPLLRQKAQALLAQPRTRSAADHLIGAIDQEQAALTQSREVQNGTSDDEIIGYDYETLDRSILDRARDARLPRNIATDLAELTLFAATDRRWDAQLALSRLDPSVPWLPERKIPPRSPQGPDPAIFLHSFARQQALEVRYLQQERGFLLGRPNPDMGLVAQLTAGIRQLRAIPNPHPGQIDPMSQPRTAEEKARWDKPMPFGSPYGADPGIAFLQQQIAQRSAVRNPDQTLITALLGRLAALQAGREPA